MMIFENENSSWSDKVNFVDGNDVFVGYDLGQKCCENAGYFLADNISSEIQDMAGFGHPDTDDYLFDKDFFQNVSSDDLVNVNMVVFRLFNKGKPDLFLHLYNVSNNGYYAHGFEVKHNGVTVKSDSL